MDFSQLLSTKVPRVLTSVDVLFVFILQKRSLFRLILDRLFVLKLGHEINKCLVTKSTTVTFVIIFHPSFVHVLPKLPLVWGQILLRLVD